ncbi:hypothetical protein HYN48_06190 [Flavobacterium magnum]|uniref:PKD domain-containing protein n=1 Tax=Flavobacterium magnum TaxID=2162713 RepID=A0A2S0RG63_9FLAO|nr:hypothetical protein [Flavobacterium magnum]AWA29702.1 hypothetical protein HYN48_06190 [Flavobacterium magnum]
MKINFVKTSYVLLASVVIGSFSACSPDETGGNGNGLADPNADATFTVTPENGSANRMVLKANGVNVTGHRWEIGDGSPEFSGADQEFIFLPDADTYTITHKAIGRGGLVTTSTKTITIATSDLAAGNLIKGGKLKNADDIAQWTVLNISASGASVTLTPGTDGGSGKATFVGSGYQQKGIYQKVTLEADKEYKLDMVVSSTAGINETWFEIYLLNAQPVDGNDYGGDKILRLNSWDCGSNVPFSGLLSDLNCDTATGTATKKGIVKVDTAGDYYLLIKSGGNQNSVISATNFSLRGSAN